MLSGIKFIDNDLAARSLEADRKASKKERKQLKKERQKQNKVSKHAAKPASESDASDSEPAGTHAISKTTTASPAVTAAAAAEDSKAPAAPAAQRDDWMSESNARPLFSDTATAAEETNEEKQAARAERMKARELNPEIRGDATAPEVPGKQPGRPAAAVVGDGGASWRMKALRRAQAQAAEEGSNLSELVSERWGSLQHLTSTLTEGRAAPARAHLQAAHSRRSAQPGNSQGGKRSAYLDDVGTDNARMKRPDDASLSWSSRKGKSSNGGRREESRHDELHGKGGSGGGRERGRHQSSDGHRARSARDPLGARADAEALRSAAPALNKFPTDGSFLDSAMGVKPPPSSNPLQAALQAGQADPQTPPSSPERSDDHDDQRTDGNGNAASAPHPHQSASPQQLSRVQGEREGPESPDQDRRAGSTSLREHGSSAGARQQPMSRGPDATEGGNKSAAAALRARLLGKAVPAAPASTAASQQPIQRPAMKDTVVLPQVDATGRAMPGEFGRASRASTADDRGGRPRKIQRYGEEGQKERYFADDDSKDLAQLVREQRYGDPGDMDAAFAANVANKARYRQKATDVDDEYDVDGGLDMYEAKRKRGNKEQHAQREKAARIADYKRMTSAQDQCNLCFASPRRSRHLTISIGQSAYLLLPPRARLVPGHCCISTLEHSPSSRAVDDHVWTEIRNFKKCLFQMFAAEGQYVIFMETAMQLQDRRSHAIIDCVPVPAGAFAKAPLFFKQEIEEAESEWSQHHAKRLIDTRAKGLRGSIPANFPYFHVEFGLSAGYVHVIDDESKFDQNLGRSTLIGLLKLPAEDVHQSTRPDSHSAQQKWALEFAKQWDPYDWTKQLA
ncbi:hypothetical protein WJX74_004333 [Apatococcus lobatus]|uniref:Uncharacterized protein n=1 Tax=Apatococcus lobatus TaxID=904363 RepID=A0AAW1R1L0_9CHLO